MARILIVDDSPTETHKITTILKGGGHDVLSAGGGEEGVAVAKKELPDSKKRKTASQGKKLLSLGSRRKGQRKAIFPLLL